MENNLSKEFHFGSLLKFALPSMIMMVFMSLYTMVDGIFVSRFVGTQALSAVNIVYPIYNVIIAIGIMLATGGSAVIAKKLGEKKEKEAKENFSLIILVGAIIGVLILIIGLLFLKPLLYMLGSNENLFPYCYSYAKVLLFFAPFGILQLLFQYFFVTAGKPSLGLSVTIVGGLANMILDYVFIVPLEMGILGAALATGIGIAIPAIFGLIYFTVNRKGALTIVKPKYDGKVLLHSCFNGSSEMVSNIAIAIVTFLYNIIMMHFFGEDGVAAITILLYSQFLLNAIFLGYSMGVAPVFSYNYGSENKKVIKRIFRYSLWFVTLTSIVSCFLAIILAPYIIAIFAKRGSSVYQIAMDGSLLFNLNYLFAGINIFVSSLFTAFSNGKISAILSFLRTFVFIVSGLISLPMIFGVSGVWFALTVAEALTIVVSILFLIRYRKKYHYGA